MYQNRPSTKDLLDVLQKAETLKETLDKNAQKHDIISGLTTEVSVFAIGFFLNKMSMLLVKSVLISNPVLFAITVSSGLLAMYYPKIRAFSQRHVFYRNYYGVASDHIEHIVETVKDFKEESNKF